MKANAKCRMRIHTEISTVVGVAAILWAGSTLGSTVVWGANTPFQVGQYWEYAHKRPRPGATEPNVIDGRRILQVLNSVGVGADARWVIEDSFTNDPNVIGRMHIADDRMLTAIVIENEKNESIKLTYYSPIPY